AGRAPAALLREALARAVASRGPLWRRLPARIRGHRRRRMIRPPDSAARARRPGCESGESHAMTDATAAAAALHARTLTLDTHVDIRWPEPPDPTTETDRQVDFPKMARGGLRAVVFVAYTPQGRRD